MKVLVIGEDPTHDQFILKPVIEAVLADAGVHARVDVLTDPPLGGIEDALDANQLAAIVADNPMVDLFVLIVDRDCNRRNAELRANERASAHAGRMLACAAWQEVEVWLAALHRDQLRAGWSEVRAHCDPKEAYVEAVMATLGTRGPGRGRKAAMRALSGQWRSLSTLCPELRELTESVRAWSNARRAN